MQIIKSRLQIVEVENLYERYTGRRIGYRYKAEYISKKQEGIVHKTVITCHEISEKAPETNVEVRISCGAEGIFEVHNFITKDPIKSGKSGHLEFARDLTLRAYELI